MSNNKNWTLSQGMKADFGSTWNSLSNGEKRTLGKEFSKSVDVGLIQGVEKVGKNSSNSMVYRDKKK